MIMCDVTPTRLLSRVLEETAVRVEQKATRWESSSVVMQQFTLCTFLHCMHAHLLFSLHRVRWVSQACSDRK